MEKRVPIMQMAHCQADLHEPAQNLVLAKWCLRLFGLADALGEVAALSVLHNDIEPSLGCSVYLPKADDVGVPQQLKNLCFPHGIGLFLRGKISQVHLFHRPFLPRCHLANEKRTPVAATAQQTDTLVNIALPLQWLVLGLLHQTINTNQRNRHSPVELGNFSMRENGGKKGNGGQWVCLWGGCVVKLVGMLLYLFVTFCAGIMSEAPKRNSTRERRPNRFLQLDDLDPPNHSASRLPDTRDARPAPENTQLARLLIRFLTAANKKLREYPDRDPIDSSSPHALPHDAQRATAPSQKQLAEKRRNGNEQAGQARSGWTQDQRRPTQEETPRGGSKQTDRKPQPNSRPPPATHNQQEAAGLRAKNPSSETQGSQTVQSQARSSLGKVEKKKRLGMVMQGRGQREELRPFKRQSFHVAIAYHIYLRRPRAGEEGTPARADPTFHARRLREMQEKQT